MRQFVNSLLLHLDGGPVVGDGGRLILRVDEDELRNPNLVVLVWKETVEVHVVLQVLKPQSGLVPVHDEVKLYLEVSADLTDVHDGVDGHADVNLRLVVLGHLQ